MKYVMTIMVILGVTVQAMAHVPNKGQFFKVFAAHKMQESLKGNVPGNVQFETRTDGGQSRVYVVNGMDDFKNIVASNPLPVVVKVHALVSKNADEVKVKFQEIADKFSKDTIFVSVDIMSKVNDRAENQQIIGMLMAQAGIFNVQLPAFLFFKHGALAQPKPVLQRDSSFQEIESAINTNFATRKKQ